MERETGIALWRQIATRLEDEIRTGKIRPGERLDTEYALAARFDVNRHTVRKAVEALQR